MSAADGEPRLPHRRDIDGLRALAIAPVVLYHCNAALLPGGFLGVDVFFVISGFVITRLLATELSAGQLSLAAFYVRRARRLLPALALVLTVVMGAGCLVFTPGELEAVARSALATLFFGSNFHFWAQRGYFEAAHQLQPLLMTWSLGIEEQFYLLWPLTLLLLWRTRWRRATVWLAGLASFALACWAARYRPGAAFYLLPFRAWELLLGAALSLQGASVSRKPHSDAASVGGVLLMLAGFVLLDRHSGVPGLASLVPCAGCALVIWAGRDALANRVLSSRLPVALGLISYSLYLWHWPLLAGARLVAGPEGLGPVALTTLVATAVLLSAATWRWVEQPFRQRGTSSLLRPAAAYAGLVGTVAAFAAAIVWHAGWPSRLAPHDSGELAQVASRAATGAGAPMVLLWGDSEALAFAPGIRSWAARIGREMEIRQHNACPPLDGVEVDFDGALFAYCTQFNADVFAAVRTNPQVDTVVLAARWPWYVAGSDFGFDRHRTGLRDRAGAPGSPTQVFSRALDRTVRELQASGKRVVLVGQLPELGFDPRSCEERRRLPNPLFEWPSCGIAAARVRERLGVVDDILAEQARRTPGVAVLLPSRILCGDLKCAATRDGVLLYMDDNHPSAAGAVYLAQFLARPE